MFETIVYICVLTCGPAPIDRELYRTKPQCVSRLKELETIAANIFKKYGIAFRTRRFCKRVHTI